MKILLTKHAEDRLLARSGISLKDFKNIYEGEKFIPVGVETGTYRRHELFYSHKLKQCFVSIRDERNSQIITILPIDYHQNIAWKITTKAQLMAENIYKGIIESNEEHEESLEEIPVIKPSIFRVVAINTNKMTQKKVGSFDCNTVSYDIDLLLTDSQFINCVKDFFLENNINDFSILEIIYGKKRESVRKVFSAKLLNDNQ